MNEELVKAKVAARKAAADVVSLGIDEEARVITECSNGNVGVVSYAFWEWIRDAALERVPLPVTEPKVMRAKPMTDEQARRFEKENIPFGQHANTRVGSVPLQYLRWLADQPFIDELRAYLANETVARQE